MPAHRPRQCYLAIVFTSLNIVLQCDMSRKNRSMASGKERFRRQSKSKFFNYAKYVCYFNDFSS